MELCPLVFPILKRLHVMPQQEHSGAFNAEYVPGLERKSASHNQEAYGLLITTSSSTRLS